MNVKNLSILSVLSFIIALQACSGGSGESSRSSWSKQDQQKESPTSVETVTVPAQDISQQIKSFGNIRAHEIVQVTPQVSNRVTRIHAELGDTVQQGEVLAKVNDVTYRDQYRQAQSQLEQSRSTYVKDSLQFQRQKELYKKDLISTTEFDNAKATFQSSKAQLESSQANLTESRENLNNTKITSPVYGTILSRNISEGDVANTGQTAFKIANLVGYQARVHLPLKEWKQVEIGQQVKFRVSNQSNVSGRGRVTQKSPRLDADTGLGEVVISLTERGSSIYQGVLVESIINVETHKNTPVIPRAALVENVQTLIEPESNSIQTERSYSVFVVQGDSIAFKRDVELGIRQGNSVEIASGISADDEIVITGQSDLTDSTKVRIADPDNFQPSSEEEVPIENMKDQQADSVSQDTSANS